MQLISKKIYLIKITQETHKLTFLWLDILGSYHRWRYINKSTASTNSILSSTGIEPGTDNTVHQTTKPSGVQDLIV